MTTIIKEQMSRKVIASEIVGFAVVLAVIWLDELIDIPYRFLGAESTPVNWRESLFETLIILPLALIIIFYTRKIFSRMKYLEGFLPICANCKKVRDEEGNWQLIESFIHDHSEARFSHGICPDCALHLYPEIFAEKSVPGPPTPKK